MGEHDFETIASTPESLLHPSNSNANLPLRLHTQGHGIDKYPAKAHARRVAEKLGDDKGLIVLAAAPSLLWPDSDMPQPFRQDRYFYYLTGCNEPGCYVTFDLQRDVLTLWLPTINKARVVWQGRGSTVEEALEKYDIDEAKYLTHEAMEPKIVRRGHQPKRHNRDLLVNYIRSITGHSDEVTALSSEHLYCDRLVSKFCPKNQRKNLRYAIDSCRVIKDEHEIALIREANRITAKAHEAVFQHLHHLTNEAEVEAEYVRICIAYHAKEQAYSPIAGSGPNAGVLHYVANDERFGDRKMMVLDAGCEVSCYASDVTRTLPLNRKKPGYWPSRECENVYRVVEGVQEACIAMMKPGNSFRDVAWHATELTTRGLLDLGVLKGDFEEVLTQGTWRAFFPHGLGHHMGLEVHDVSPGPRPKEDSSKSMSVEDSHIAVLPPPWQLMSSWLATEPLPTSTSGARPDYALLKPGMIITVEPGIYFNSFLLENFFLNDPKHARFIDKEVLERYMDVGGVRIEDDILVTKEGYENLTVAPKGEAMLECIRRGTEEAARRERGEMYREAMP
ncbi:hypothetical protein LTR86_006383 [Recurvomyces mirabilis]|nr:hypothetical protein LTR86_006383 [Recurvomyces mirabilis]